MYICIYTYCVYIHTHVYVYMNILGLGVSGTRSRNLLSSWTLPGRASMSKRKPASQNRTTVWLFDVGCGLQSFGSVPHPRSVPRCSCVSPWPPSLVPLLDTCKSKEGSKAVSGDGGRRGVSMRASSLFSHVTSRRGSSCYVCAWSWSRDKRGEGRGRREKTGRGACGGMRR